MSKCEHGKRKSRCVDCGGSEICEHNKIKSRCIECGGESICEHQKRKDNCRECGNSYCKHGKKKSRCKECGGSALCEHGREKRQCVKCGGDSICEHKIRKIFCVVCDGSAICEHNKRKWQCVKCGGSSYCKHGKRKSGCVECGGTEICIHNINKRYCKECDGSIFCVHDKNKYRCKICDGRSLCKSEWCEVRGIPKYEGYCLSCCIQVCPDIKVCCNYKTKENAVIGLIKEHFPDFTWVHDKRVEGGCSKRRPDLLLDLGTHVIIVEVDENRHNDYDCSCEHKRLMEISRDLSHRNIVFIRFNPDEYTDSSGKTVKSCWRINKLGLMGIMKSKESEWQQRIHLLKEKIQYFVENPSEKMVEIIELFY
jgi:hypothetical protein